MAAELAGLVAVARNPVEAGYVRLNGAPGAIYQAISLGKIYLKEIIFSVEKAMEAIISFFQAGGYVHGQVEQFTLNLKGGFDIGQIKVKFGNLCYSLSLYWTQVSSDSGNLSLNSQRINKEL